MVLCCFVCIELGASCCWLLSNFLAVVVVGCKHYMTFLFLLRAEIVVETCLFKSDFSLPPSSSVFWPSIIMKDLNKQKTSAPLYHLSFFAPALPSATTGRDNHSWHQLMELHVIYVIIFLIVSERLRQGKSPQWLCHLQTKQHLQSYQCSACINVPLIND